MVEDEIAYQPPTETELAQMRADLAAKRARLVAEHETRLEEERQQSIAETAAWEAAQFSRLAAMAAELRCGGNIAGISECPDDFAPTCPARTTPGCPRMLLAHAEQERSARARDRLAAAGITADAIDTLASMDMNRQAIVGVREWHALARRLLLLSGRRGTGKSVAGAHAIQLAEGGRFVHSSTLVEISVDGDEQRQAAKRTRLLVIDDFEKAGAGDFAKNTIGSIVCIRYDNKLPTVITTNLPAAHPKDQPGRPARRCDANCQHFDKLADPRILDRFRGSGKVVTLMGESMRGRA